MTAPFVPSLTDRELRWLRHIAVHGPQSSEFLLELVSDTHRCKDTGLRTLQKLRKGDYLRLPPQQNEIAKANFNPHLYELTRHAELHLQCLGDLQTVRPTGHWWHAFLTASVTSAMTIEAARRGITYIPAHEILARANTTLAVPVGRKTLIPDQLFALRYPTGFRSFVLEVDRSTEPYRSGAARKSLATMLDTYAALNTKDTLRRHYGLKSSLLVLLVFVSPARAARCLKRLTGYPPAFARSALVTVIQPGFPRCAFLANALCQPWQRAGLAPFNPLEAGG